MQIVTAIRFKMATANYAIRMEAPGVYQAELVNFDGDANQRPPLKITLIRSVRSWTGSIDDEMLLNQLGAAMEANKKKKKSKTR